MRCEICDNILSNSEEAFEICDECGFHIVDALEMDIEIEESIEENNDN